MTLEQLRIFVGVAEREHMTRAAEALNVTQSAASAAIAALEARVKAATDAGVINTPTFFVNGRQVSSMGGEGAVMADLGPAIEAELAK